MLALLCTMRPYVLFANSAMHAIEHYLPRDIALKIVVMLQDALVAAVQIQQLGSIWTVPKFQTQPGVHIKIRHAGITFRFQHVYKSISRRFYCKWKPVLRTVELSQHVMLFTNTNLVKQLRRSVHYSLNYTPIPVY